MRSSEGRGGGGGGACTPTYSFVRRGCGAFYGEKGGGAWALFVEAPIVLAVLIITS